MQRTTNRFASATGKLFCNACFRQLRISIDGCEETVLEHASRMEEKPARMRNVTFQRGNVTFDCGMQTKSKGPSMLKFGLGVVVGIFIGIFLRHPSRELGELFAWLALGTML